MKLDSTITANDIHEEIPNINNIRKYMKEHKFKEGIVKSELVFGSPIEKKLASMYTYHYFHK
jgi:hypothetical protein